MTLYQQRMAHSRKLMEWHREELAKAAVEEDSKDRDKYIAKAAQYLEDSVWWERHAIIFADKGEIE